jgi:hypothetical protein
MGRPTPEELARHRREVAATLAQVDDMQAAAEIAAASAVDSAVEDEPAAWPVRRDPLDPRNRSSAPLNRWRTEAEETERRRQQERERSKRQQEEHVRQMQAKSDDAWNEWLSAGIEAAIKRDWDLHRDVHAQVIAEERRRERKELAEAIDKLRAEFKTQLRELRAELQDDGKIIDLPKGSWRRDVA